MGPASSYKFIGGAFRRIMNVTPLPNGRIEFTTGGQRFPLEAEDVPALAAAVLGPSSLKQFPRQLGAGQETVSEGTGKTEARVYVPTSDGGAERNLNFAKANLAAYLTWVEREPERKKAQQAAMEKVRQAEKAMEELKASVRNYAAEATLLARALAAYNAFRNTNIGTWEGVFAPFNVDKLTVDRWVRVVQDIDKTTAPK